MEAANQEKTKKYSRQIQTAQMEAMNSKRDLEAALMRQREWETLPTQLRLEINALHKEIQNLEESKYGAESDYAITVRNLQLENEKLLADIQRMEEEVSTAHAAADEAQNATTQVGQESLECRAQLLQAEARLEEALRLMADADKLRDEQRQVFLNEIDTERKEKLELQRQSEEKKMNSLHLAKKIGEIFARPLSLQEYEENDGENIEALLKEGIEALLKELDKEKKDKLELRRNLEEAQRDGGGEHRQLSPAKFQDAGAMKEFAVDVLKPLGLLLKQHSGRVGSAGVFVTSCVAGGNAEKTGKFLGGDQIVFIGNQDVSSATVEQVAQAIGKAQAPVCVRIRRNVRPGNSDKLRTTSTCDEVLKEDLRTEGTNERERMVEEWEAEKLKFRQGLKMIHEERNMLRGVEDETQKQVQEHMDKLQEELQRESIMRQGHNAQAQETKENELVKAKVSDGFEIMLGVLRTECEHLRSDKHQGDEKLETLGRALQDLSQENNTLKLQQEQWQAVEHALRGQIGILEKRIKELDGAKDDESAIPFSNRSFAPRAQRAAPTSRGKQVPSAELEDPPECKKAAEAVSQADAVEAEAVRIQQLEQKKEMQEKLKELNLTQAQLEAELVFKEKQLNESQSTIALLKAKVLVSENEHQAVLVEKIRQLEGEFQTLECTLSVLYQERTKSESAEKMLKRITERKVAETAAVKGLVLERENKILELGNRAKQLQTQVEKLEGVLSKMEEDSIAQQQQTQCLELFYRSTLLVGFPLFAMSEP